MTYLSKSHLFVDAMKADIKAERLVAGLTTEGKGDDFKGCWIGCVLREYSHEGMANSLSWPLPLVRISETIFEGLNNKENEQAFAVDILAAPKPNADVSLIHWKFLHWLVSDTLEKYADSKTQKACEKAVKVLRDKADGKEVSADAAGHAADAGHAAYAAAYAAYAAYAARAADTAADAARAARYKEMADKLIEIMKEAPAI